MIFISKEKYTVDGVDVYPDHEDTSQYWYVPGTVRLAERDKKKVLSYFWYTDSATDSDGTGYLNFEVNTAVTDVTRDKIRALVAKSKGVDAAKLRLAAVPYTGGNVNFSVLGPIVQKAPEDLNKKDGSVLRQSPEQLVWSAGSSSLVGDNAAVCSVKFTKEGKLAGAMKQVIESGSNSIAAVYGLEFLAMRPSVTFKVHGTMEKTVTDFQLSIGAQIPLEALILDIGIQAQWQRIMQNTDLKIEVINFTGEPEEGELWAKKFLLDYILKNFFEVQMGNKGDFIPLPEAPEVEKTIDKAKDVEESAKEKVDEEGEKKGEEADGAVKEIVKGAMSLIPRVGIRAAYYNGKQVNTIDVLYNEMKAKPYSIAPQALVLEGLGASPKDYIMSVNRTSIPFGLAYPVPVVLPPDVDRAKAGVQAINVMAWYPAGQTRDKQQSGKLTVSAAGAVTGPNPFPFQYDDKGSSAVEYGIDYVFNPSDDWNTSVSQYSYKGKSETGLITAMPAGALAFQTIDIRLAGNFTWEDNDQVVVSLTGKSWTGAKTVVLQNGQDGFTSFKVRSGADTKDTPIQYVVSVRRNNKELYKYGPEVVMNGQIEIHDRFTDHIPVIFKANFNTATTAQILMSYEDGEYVWESEVTLDKGKTVQSVVPTLKEFKRKSDLRINCEITPDQGDTFKLEAKAGLTNTIKA